MKDFKILMNFSHIPKFEILGWDSDAIGWDSTHQKALYPHPSATVLRLM
jgi:hypothetical protein